MHMVSQASKFKSYCDFFVFCLSMTNKSSYLPHVFQLFWHHLMLANVLHAIKNAVIINVTACNIVEGYSVKHLT